MDRTWSKNTKPCLWVVRWINRRNSRYSDGGSDHQCEDHRPIRLVVVLVVEEFFYLLISVWSCWVKTSRDSKVLGKSTKSTNKTRSTSIEWSISFGDTPVPHYVFVQFITIFCQSLLVVSPPDHFTTRFSDHFTTRFRKIKYIENYSKLCRSSRYDRLYAPCSEHIGSIVRRFSALVLLAYPSITGVLVKKNTGGIWSVSISSLCLVTP